MPVTIHASQLSVIEEHGVLVTTLAAPSTEDEDFYLMLQHKPAYDGQDLKFGMNKPYIEFCGQGWSWYGHILSFTLHRNRVNIQMDQEAAERMRNDGNLEVTFSANLDEFKSLQAAIQKTFRGYSYFRDEA